MAKYDYKCESCNVIIEHSHKMTETPKFTCPTCSNILKRIINNSFNIKFKGSGFYVNDNKG